MFLIFLSLRDALAGEVNCRVERRQSPESTTKAQIVFFGVAKELQQILHYLLHIKTDEAVHLGELHVAFAFN